MDYICTCKHKPIISTVVINKVLSRILILSIREPRVGNFFKIHHPPKIPVNTTLDYFLLLKVQELYNLYRVKFQQDGMY